jgi:hypothetical protein
MSDRSTWRLEAQNERLREDVRSLEERLEELRAAANQADAEYRAEIERLESRLRFADAVIRSGDVAALTVDEREAVERAADWLYRWQETHGYHSSENGDLATLRSLLERTR